MKAAHRHFASGHEHEFEAQPGLPEALPPGESLLWQGSPDGWLLACRAFHLRKLAIYFAALVVLRAAFALNDGATLIDALRSTLAPMALAALALSLVGLLAWLSARSTLYTITDRRVVMRIGIVLTLTFNIPFKRIAAAGLHLDANGTGDLPLTLLQPDRIAWLQLWPHARPWRLGRPEPMLRCVPDAQRVARLLASAWSQANGLAPGLAGGKPSAPVATGEPRTAVRRPSAAAQPAAAQAGAGQSGSVQPALAGR